MKIACAVLAAGQSRRFGNADKLTSPLGDRPLVRWTLDRIPREVFSDLCAVVTSDAVAAICENAGFDYVRYAGGQLSDSIRRALSFLPDDVDGYLFVNGDRPFLRAETIRRMAERFSGSPDAAERLFWGETPSNPILFPRAARAELLKLEGDKGGSAVLKSGRFRVLRTEAADETETWDVDCPEALERMKRELLKRGQDLVYD